MPTELRHIAIHVEEPEAGDFRWVLTERASGDTWEVRQKSDSAASTYQQAMADGLVALQLMVADLDVGPRRAVKTASASKQRPQNDDRSTAVGQGESGAPSFFGFGPVR